MALNFPYTFISCPCSDVSRRILTSSKRTSRDIDIDQALQEDEVSFDPKSPRSAFSLFPIEHLYYCEDCQDLKCPRCVTEEIISWYCPQCLFDAVPSSVKADSNRCSRNCYTCPICQSQLQTSAINTSKASDRPYILNCQYCMWTSLDAGIDFSNPSGIRQQMDKRDGRRETSSVPSDNARTRGLSSLSKEYVDSQKSNSQSAQAVSDERLDHQSQFNNLKQFYKEQLAMTDTTQSSLDAAFSSSPASITRIMNLYSSNGTLLRNKKPKNQIMREALTQLEGLRISQHLEVSEVDPLDSVTPEQLHAQYPASLGNTSVVTVSDLKPMPTLLRTKRSKRCASCKHILVKPELKVTSTRYRIKLVALNYIPFINLKPVPATGAPLPAGPDGDPTVILPPSKPSQWIVTLKNPLFENVNVSLGSPSITPGKFGHRVTILCPQFSIGKNGEVWDDALQPEAPIIGDQIAGKVYDRGRNWTSIVIEIVPASIITSKDEVLGEDDTVIEVPIRVRLEWKVTDEQALRNENADRKDGEDADDGTRELAYWMVLGIGRVG